MYTKAKMYTQCVHSDFRGLTGVPHVPGGLGAVLADERGGMQEWSVQRGQEG